jgi:hypothetical protein
MQVGTGSEKRIVISIVIASCIAVALGLALMVVAICNNRAQLDGTEGVGSVSTVDRGAIVSVSASEVITADEETGLIRDNEVVPPDPEAAVRAVYLNMDDHSDSSLI